MRHRQPAIRVLRGDASQRDFTQDIEQLTDYLADEGHQPVRAIPGKHNVLIWLLGSSLQSADLAVKSGLPYAFASYFAPRFLMDAIAHYRSTFRPSAELKQPHVVAGANVFAAQTRA